MLYAGSKQTLRRQVLEDESEGRVGPGHLDSRLSQADRLRSKQLALKLVGHDGSAGAPMLLPSTDTVIRAACQQSSRLSGGTYPREVNLGSQKQLLYWLRSSVSAAGIALGNQQPGRGFLQTTIEFVGHLPEVWPGIPRASSVPLEIQTIQQLWSAHPERIAACKWPDDYSRLPLSKRRSG